MRWPATAVFLLAVLLPRSPASPGRRVKRQQTFNAGDLLGFLSNLATQAASPSFLQQQSPSDGGYGQYPLGSGQYPSQNPQDPSHFPGQYPQQPGQYPAQYPQQPGQLPGLYPQGGGQYPQRPGQFPGQFQGLYPQGAGLYPGQYPPSSNLIGALGSIARYDTLRCVPRLLCEVAAGGRPGYTGKQESIIPFINRDTLLTLLTVFNFGDGSPLLVFGRAALLGLTAQGDPQTCLSAYPTCPRDPDQLVYYLNNHNGGFFRFFNRHPQGRLSPETAPIIEENKLQKINGDQDLGTSQREREHKPIKFPRKAEDNNAETPQMSRSEKSMKFPEDERDSKARITTNNQRPYEEITAEVDSNPFTYQYNSQHELIFPNINDENVISESSGNLNTQQYNSGPAFTFPNINNENSFYESYDASFTQDNPGQHFYLPNTDSGDAQHLLYGQSSDDNNRKPKALKTRTRFSFPSEETNVASSPQLASGALEPQRPEQPVPMVFPDRTGTGDLRLDTDEFGRIVIFSASADPPGYRDSNTFFSREQRQAKELQFPKRKSVAEDQPDRNKTSTSNVIFFRNSLKETVVFPKSETD